MSAVRVARELVVHGEVQGVSFRESCRREAVAAGVAGWVLNQVDGTVRVWFEGSPGAVEAMVSWCRLGPRHARVDRVEDRDVEPTGDRDFEVR